MGLRGEIFVLGFLISASLYGRSDFSYSIEHFHKKDFRHVLRKHKKIIFYTVSGGMPLSTMGLPLIREVARKKGYRLTIISDPVIPVGGYKAMDRNNFFVSQGLFNHFPSVLLYKNKKACGGAMPGYKNIEGFREIVENLETECGVAAPEVFLLESMPTTSSGVLVKQTVLPHSITYYTRPIDNNWVAYNTGAATEIFNRSSEQEIPFQGSTDLIPSPDAKYLTLPQPLQFFLTADVIANPAQAIQLPPVLSDATMTDQYQSLGILSPGNYRAIEAWTAAVSQRDYSDTSGTLTPGAPEQKICRSTALSTPVISKNGQYVGAYVQATRTTQILDIGPNADACDLIIDLGVRTGKVDFNNDSTLVAYMSEDATGANLGPFVENITNGNVIKVTDVSATEAITFPSFLPNGNVLVLRVQKSGASYQYLLQEYSIPSLENEE